MTQRAGFYYLNGTPVPKDRVLDGAGVYTYGNGDEYRGTFAASRFEGSGALKMGAYLFTGHFRNDKLHGQGVLSESSTGYTVSGEWENDRCTKVTGKGVRWVCVECHGGFDTPAALRRHAAV